MSLSNTVLLSSEYFPSIAWYQKYLQAGEAYIEQLEYFEKSTLRNRCYISGPNGMLALSVPIEGGRGMHIPINEIKIAKESNWQQQHWRSLLASYNRSPYFEYYEMEFAHFFEKKYSNLFALNLESILLLNKLMQIKKSLLLTKVYQKSVPANCIDYRRTHKLQHNLPSHQLKYIQPFEGKQGFLDGLSMIDLLFCAGKQAMFGGNSKKP
ncbi:MAG: WbqC family protein [Bacteroidetes bacterium]|nr:WbqC family protein [Bacteroidota bacterium]